MNNVAMLIDWENIKATALEFLRTPPDVITLKKIARSYGTLRIARAYANWTDASGWHTGDAERLSAQGIEPVFVLTRHGRSGTYEKDLVDLRLACDGMELLAIHPEIDCFIVVSGDGALETLLTKLSGRGKRVVRVAVEKALGRGVHVLGEERVLYDGWVKGFQPASSPEVDAAVRNFAAAVGAMAQEGGDMGLHSVKARMRRDDADFEEERLGIATFRHLAYIAELMDLVRIDARPEPAQAYAATAERASDGSVLPSGKIWRRFIAHLDPRKDFDNKGIESCIRDGGGLGELSPSDMLALAIRSDVVSRVTSKHVTQGQKEWFTSRLRLNSHHPRVQVALATPLQ